MLVATFYGMDRDVWQHSIHDLPIIMLTNTKIMSAQRKIFCRGLELHIKRDGSQPKGGANLVKSHVSSLIS
ncbi:hypothetical protein T03_7877 [Trichinella britovi]|uniref:Uncharacterized protein n=1 Tax=Trichinella britovi TaxID=45882 RepID=A0A0V1C4Y6_TRIBR|nr:hypothetical protein T03_10785 [Trichinella britovi]KRY44377.1 hypothetical protein T03_7877 [Trichinella britovi]